MELFKLLFMTFNSTNSTTDPSRPTSCNGTTINSSLVNCSSSENGTDPTGGPEPPFIPMRPYPPLQEWEAILAVVFFCIIILFITVGNLLVLVSYAINRKLRTTTNTFIASLAAADLIVGALSVPLWCYFLLDSVDLVPQELQPDDIEIWYSIWLKLDIFAGVASVNHLTAISLERAYALLRPLKHRRIRKRWIILAIILAWTSGAGIAALHYREWEEPHTYALMVTVAFFFFPLLVILGSYAVIFFVAHSSIASQGRRTMKKDLKIAVTIAMVVGIFVVCWLPFHSMNLVLTLCMQCPFDMSRVIIVIKVGHYSNSGVNAIIYGFRNAEFNRTFKRIFWTLICKKVPTAYYQDRRSTMAHTQSTVMTRTDVNRKEELRDSYVRAINKGVPNKKLGKKTFVTDEGHFNDAVMMNDLCSDTTSDERLNSKSLISDTLSDNGTEQNHNYTEDDTPSDEKLHNKSLISDTLSDSETQQNHT